jgi:hypothetical protein
VSRSATGAPQYVMQRILIAMETDTSGERP